LQILDYPLNIIARFRERDAFDPVDRINIGISQILRDQQRELVAARTPALRALDPQHVELADQVPLDFHRATYRIDH